MSIYLPVKTLKGVGDKTANTLGKLGIYSINDLISYYPRNYEKLDSVTLINELKVNEINVIEGTIISPVEVLRKGRIQILKVVVADETGTIHLIWYNQLFMKNKLKKGDKYIFRGQIVLKYGQYQMQKPDIFEVDVYRSKQEQLQPIYPLTKGLTQNSLRKQIGNALEQIKDVQDDFLDDNIITKHNLCSNSYAIKGIHYPDSYEQLSIARRRLVFEEFLLYQLALMRLKEHKEKAKNRFVFEHVKEIDYLIDSLPYELTNAQKKVWNEIVGDFCSNTVMNRLVQGDVGSGKTIIAALALLYVCKNRFQSSMMAPTEVLAKQHYETITNLLEGFDVKIGLLVGSMTKKQKNEMYIKIKNKEVDIVIGTHALIQEKVEFNNLALVVTDEQHRFGVKQRETLSNKGNDVHVLVMSATPIPRTLALIVYGDLDVSVIDELPPNRQVIETYTVNTNYRPRIYDFINKQVSEGRQVYIVCPMVEESDELELEAVVEYSEKLKDNLETSIIVEYLHGKMKPKEKNRIMEEFLKNEIQVLVSTTVIEVGVNVPNATLMIIENAERFGLAQLHQLRGRVGRGSYQSYCILISASKSKKTNERLKVLSDSNDGFVIAEYDLKTRGPGDLFGIKQHGELVFKIADVFQHIDLLKEANIVAKKIIKEDFKLEKNSKLNQKLNEYYRHTLSNIQL